MRWIAASLKKEDASFFSISGNDENIAFSSKNELSFCLIRRGVARADEPFDATDCVSSVLPRVVASVTGSRWLQLNDANTLMGGFLHRLFRCAGLLVGDLHPGKPIWRFLWPCQSVQKAFAPMLDIAR